MKNTFTRHEELSSVEISRQVAWRLIVARAWHDDAFKQRVLTKPNEVFKEFGIDVPDGITIKVVEDSAAVKHVVLPGHTHDVSEIKSSDCCDPGF
jgi:Nitrile hydratase, alpha chain